MRRSLDLTGPLLLGGVPNLPEDFPVRNRNFVGCMRNLRIDSRAIDMDSYIANNGTTAGKELPYCQHCTYIFLHEDAYCQYIVESKNKQLEIEL